MLEDYNVFLDRVSSFEHPELLINNDGLLPNQKLIDKVKEDNSFRSFFGDTVVFDFDEDVKERVSEMIEELYEIVPECFCEKIKKETIHITLHDLSNSPIKSEVENQMKINEEQLQAIVNIFSSDVIRMKTNFVINMVDVSLVLAAKPASEEDYNNLMKYYKIIDEVKPLNYNFTPHITLAYYNRNGFDKIAAQKLKKVVEKMNESCFEFSLNTNKLLYQHFYSMNDYENIFCFVNED